MDATREMVEHGGMAEHRKDRGAQKGWRDTGDGGAHK
jgi:hypothetical protein